MGNTLIVYYSFTGNSRRLANLLAAQRGWPVGEVTEAHPRSGSGWGYIRCVLDSMLRRKPSISYAGPEPADFPTVILVAPIWVGQLAGPMRSFVSSHRHQIRRAAVLVSMGGQGGSEAVAEIARITGRDPVTSEVVTARQIDDGSCAQAIEAFATSVKRSMPAAPVRPAVWSPEAG